MNKPRYTSITFHEISHSTNPECLLFTEFDGNANRKTVVKLVLERYDAEAIARELKMLLDARRKHADSLGELLK